jgi:hypothetical protein
MMANFPMLGTKGPKTFIDPPINFDEIFTEEFNAISRVSLKTAVLIKLGSNLGAKQGLILTTENLDRAEKQGRPRFTY